MKKFCFLSVLTALITLSDGHGNEPMIDANYCYGSRNYGRETLSSLQTNGSVILKGTQVLGLVQINGSLTADEAILDSLHINGKASLKNCLIKNGASINGELSADNTKFEHEISVASKKITLGACSLGSLIVREIAGFEGLQIIDIRNGTSISGPIVIESGNGEIWVSSNSKISGEITGAKVVKK